MANFGRGSKKREPKSRPIASDPNFSKLVKEMFRLIQFLHHFKILAGQMEGNLTKSFRKKVQDLNQFFKPPAPTKNLMEALWHQNSLWMKNQTSILLGHYGDKIEECKKSISGFQSSKVDFDRAQHLAISWAQKNFRKKLKNETLNQFRSTLGTLAVPSTKSNPSQGQKSTGEPNLAKEAPSIVSQPNTYARVVSTPPAQALTPISSGVRKLGISDKAQKKSMEKAQSPSLAPKDSKQGSKNKEPLQNSRSNSPKPSTSGLQRNQIRSNGFRDTKKSPKVQNPRASSPILPSGQADKVREVIGPSDPLSNFYPCKINYMGDIYSSLEHLYTHRKADYFDDINVINSIPKAKTASQAKAMGKHLQSSSWDRVKLGIMEDLLLIKYEQCAAFRDSLIDSCGSKLVHTVPCPFWGTGRYNNGRNMFGKALSTLRDLVTSDGFQISMSPQNTNDVSTFSIGDESYLAPDSPMAPQPNLAQKVDILPFRAKNSQHKNKDWQFSAVEEKTLILGDSNLSRISKSRVQHLDIRSYPGAKLQHITSLLQKASKTSPKPETVIISVGINDRDNNPKATSFPEFQRLAKQAKYTFPSSKLWFVPTQFKPQHLNQKQIANLKTLNEKIQESELLDIIPWIEDSSFKIDPCDPYQIHWTTQTANNLLDHWLNHVGFLN